MGTALTGRPFFTGVPQFRVHCQFQKSMTPALFRKNTLPLPSQRCHLLRISASNIFGSHGVLKLENKRLSTNKCNMHSAVSKRIDCCGLRDEGRVAASTASLRLMSNSVDLDPTYSHALSIDK